MWYLAYHVNVLPWCWVINHFVKLTTCLFVRQLTIVVLCQTCSVVKNIVHDLLDGVTLYLLLLLNLLIHGHSTLSFAIRALLHYHYGVIKALVLYVLCLSGYTHIWRSLVLLDNYWLIEWILTLRWLLRLVCIESFAKVYISRCKTRVILQLLPKSILTTFRSLLDWWWLLKYGRHISCSL